MAQISTHRRPPVSPRHWPTGALGLVLLLAASSCDDLLGPDDAVPRPPDARPWVTGAARAALDGEGRFRLPEPVAPGTEPIIVRPFAGDLALAFIRSVVVDGSTIPGMGSIRESFEAQHGGPIDWDAIELEERRAYYAESAYEPLPDSVPLPVRRSWGPAYLVPLYEGGEQVVSLVVAAYATDLWIDGQGRVRRSSVFGGNEFRGTGNPAGLPFGIPLWPEQAVGIVAEATGAKVSEVPVLIAPARPWSEVGARWRITLDREVEVDNLDTGERVRTRIVYVGVWGPPVRVVWYLPTPDQRRTETLRYTVPVSPPDSVTRHEIEVRFRTNVPSRFHEVEPIG